MVLKAWKSHSPTVIIINIINQTCLGLYWENISPPPVNLLTHQADIFSQ